MFETEPGERPQELEEEPGDTGEEAGEDQAVTPAEDQPGSGPETGDQPDPDREGPDPDSVNPAG
jgi:hypothetical protein